MAISFTPQPLNKFMLEDPNYLLAKKLQGEQTSGPAKGGVLEVLARLLRGHQIGQEKRAGRRTFDKMRENQAATLNQVKSLLQPPAPRTPGEITAIQEHDTDFGQPQQFDTIAMPQAVKKPGIGEIASVLMGSKDPKMQSQGLELALQNMAKKAEIKSKLDVARAKNTREFEQNLFLGNIRDKRRADNAFLKDENNFYVDRQKAINYQIEDIGKNTWDGLNPAEQEKLLGVYHIKNAPKRSDYFQMPRQGQGQGGVPLTQDQVNFLSRTPTADTTLDTAPDTTQRPIQADAAALAAIDESAQGGQVAKTQPPTQADAASFDFPEVSNFSSNLKTITTSPNSNKAINLTTPVNTPTDGSGIVDETTFGQSAHEFSSSSQRRLIDLIPKDAKGRPKFSLHSEQGQKFLKSDRRAIKIIAMAKAFGKNAPKALAKIKSKRQIVSAMNILGPVLKDMSQFRGQAMRAGQNFAEQVAGGLKQAYPDAAKIFGGIDTQQYQQLIRKLQSQEPILLNFIRKATEQGARSLDSNKELEFYKQAVGNAAQDPYVALFALSQLDAYYGAESLGLENTIKKAIGDKLYNRVRNQSNVTLKRVKAERQHRKLFEEVRLGEYQGADAVRAKKMLGFLSGKIGEYTAYEQNFDPEAIVPR